MRHSLYCILMMYILLSLGCSNKPSVTQTSNHGSNRLYPIEVKKKWGFINNKGHIVVRPRYDHASIFNDGLLGLVKIGEHSSALVDSKGKTVLTVDGYLASDFSEGPALLESTNGELQTHQYIDEVGNVVIPDQGWDYALGFDEGLALVSYKKKIGFIDKNGEYAIPPIYDDGSWFSEGLAAIRVGEEWGYIDKHGAIIITPRFSRAGDFYEGLACFTFNKTLGLRPSDWGFIDIKGNIVIKNKYVDVQDFSEGLAPVSIIIEAELKWGFINTQGELVIEPRFDYAYMFREGLAPVEVGKLWGYIDKTGKYIVNPTYDSAGYFNNGLALVTEGNISGYIDKNGKYIWKSYK